MKQLGEKDKQRGEKGVDMKEPKVCFSSQFIRLSLQYVNFRVRACWGWGATLE